MPSSPSRGQARGATIGAMVLTMFGAAWAVGAIVNRPQTPGYAWVIAALPPLLLWVWTIRRFAGLGRLAPAPDRERAAREGRAAGRVFGMVVAIEVVLIAIAATSLGAIGRPLLIPVYVAGIVGAHFLPLASTFRIPVYAITGWLLVGAAAGSLLVADERLRDFLLGIMVALILWATAGIVLGGYTGASGQPRTP